MTRPASFHEASAERRVQSVPLAHLSIELGHLYAEDLAGGPAAIGRAFAAVAPWVRAARTIAEASAPRRPRVSTCFLVDDYFSSLVSPAELVPQLVAGAREHGLEIDYLARESACAEADGVPLAELVSERIVADPPPGSTGLRPPVTDSGWLCNGERAAGGTGNEAMAQLDGWRPPTENAARRHSIFVDVELWDQRGRDRTWSCAYLAGVWQLLRLGLLRDHGAPVATPQPWPRELPQRWDQLPAVIQRDSRSAPFCAYRSLSILPGRFFPTEHAVRTLLSQVAVDPVVAGQVAARSAGEGIRLPAEPVDRISYVLLSG